jgi:ribosome-binding protein aMBF1 (putative translation factor)
VFLGGILLYAMRRKRCEVCGNFLERKKYFWNIEGEKKRVCSHCNRTFMRRQSRAATRNMKAETLGSYGKIKLLAGIKGG